MTLDLRKVVSFAPSLGTPLIPKGVSSVLPDIFTVPTENCQDIKENFFLSGSVVKKLDRLEADIQSLIGMLFRPSSLP